MESRQHDARSAPGRPASSPQIADLKAQHKYIERMGGALTAAGMTSLPARLFAALTIDDDGRMTADELCEATGTSPASVSTAMKVLTGINFVHKERERGGRRNIYVVDDDAWLSATLQHDHLYRPMVVALDEAIEALPESDDPHGARHRLVLMREFLVFVQQEMSTLMDRWLERKATLDS